jgi:bifunctional non-homologous end joining protein LigD
LAARKALLERALRHSAPGVLYSKHTLAAGSALYRAAERHALEGIVGKRLQSAYREGRSRDWVKIKVQRRQECVIGGWTEPRASREQFGSLLLGLYEAGTLRYAGHVGSGFTHQLLGSIMRKLAPLETPGSPFGVRPRTNTRSHWVKPRLVAEVKFAEWTRDGVMRQPVFLGLREDKRPKECVREQPLPERAIR